MKKIFLLLLLFAIVGHVLVKAQSAPPFWAEIHAFKKQDNSQSPPANPILFVGSSSFARWDNLPESFPGHPILNRGFGGSTLVDVIKYTYDIVLPYQPKQVVIYCGENDLADDTTTAEGAVRRFKTLFGMIRTNLPATRISYVSIKPSPSRIQYQDKMKAANKEIKRFLKKQKNADFIDIYNAMLDNQGNMREELYVADRLHMKPEGYVIWQTIITPYLLK